MTLDNVRVHLQSSGASLASVERGGLGRGLTVSILPSALGWSIVGQTPIDGFFRLERSLDLKSWMPVGNPQSSEGGVVRFEDSESREDALFYRVLVIEPESRGTAR
jgi:hypothetical protein